MWPPCSAVRMWTARSGAGESATNWAQEALAGRNFLLGRVLGRSLFDHGGDQTVVAHIPIRCDLPVFADTTRPTARSRSTVVRNCAPPARFSAERFGSPSRPRARPRSGPNGGRPDKLKRVSQRRIFDKISQMANRRDIFQNEALPPAAPARKGISAPIAYATDRTIGAIEREA
jgi:hypothetical protein